MTNEEAIKMLISKMDGNTDTSYEWAETVRMAIKALEQQPSEDCVSRQAVLDNAYAYGNGLEPEGYCVNVEDIQALPPVAPTRKVGKWVNKSHKSGCGISFIASECTCCRKKTLFNCDELLYNYCPNCGAEMRGDENDSIT